MCKYYKEGCCPRPAFVCWFWHPEQSVKFIPDNDAPLLVQSMIDVIKYVRKELVTDPNKYNTSATRRAAGPQVLAKDRPLPVVSAQDNEVQPL